MDNLKKINRSCILAILVVQFLLVVDSYSQGFLKTDGRKIVDEKGSEVILQGMGLGGWMLQEGYMLRFQGPGQQHVIRGKIEEVIGKKGTEEFYTLWLNNHARKVDIDSLRSWGFNSVRLPLHYNLFTLPIEAEPAPGKDTWLTQGFALTDSLVQWCKANGLYLILDLHAAPGGQGNDFNISDRDPSKPSLWDSKENQRKTVALWRKLAERYRNEPIIAGYDLINEPNWGFTDPADKNGLKEPNNGPLRKLLVDISKAIREVDKNHIIIIEGNGWGNNYDGIFPLWDKNTVVSFHKYWNYNSKNEIQKFLDIRDKYNVPIWLGETGENSNTWFTELISLLHEHKIGWAWWPLKKLGANNPLEVKMPEGYQQLLDYWGGKGSKPDEDVAKRALISLAENTKLENCIYHKDVVDAMFRQTRTNETIPFKNHTPGQIIFAVDYDLGKNGYAYFDTDTADYHISTSGDWLVWNEGRVYRNDGVDILSCSDSVNNGYLVKAKPTEWLQYTINLEENQEYDLVLRTAKGAGKITIQYNDLKKEVELEQSNKSEDLNWNTSKIKALKLKKGENKIRLYFQTEVLVNYLQLIKTAPVTKKTRK